MCSNQVWFVDITYVELADGSMCYLYLITHIYSHKVVGLMSDYAWDNSKKK